MDLTCDVLAGESGPSREEMWHISKVFYVWFIKPEAVEVASDEGRLLEPNCKVSLIPADYNGD